MKIDAWDKKILTNLYQNSRATLGELSKKVGLPKENIHYKLKRFEKANFINYIPYSNLSKLGYDYFLVRMRVDPFSNKYNKFINDLTKSKSILWLSETGIYRGTDYNITAIKLHNNFSTVQDYFTDLVNTNTIERFELSLIGTMGFNYNYNLFNWFMKTGTHRFENKIDEKDIKIVLKLFENSRVSLNELGSKLKLSPLTIKNRIKKLVENGIINRFIISLNFNKLDGKFIVVSYDVNKKMVSLKIREVLSKYFSDIVTISVFFTQKRMLFGYVKDKNKFLKAMSELNKIDGMNISSVYENTRILKNKIF
jgi:DNA-binding Lrp family transcriptional regulator